MIFKFTANLHDSPVHRKLTGDVTARNLADAVTVAGHLLTEAIQNPPSNVKEWRSIDLKIRVAK